VAVFKPTSVSFNYVMQKTAPKILILDAMWNKTLAAVRSLGRRGFYLAVGEKTRFATAIFSRYCSRRLIYPSPLSKPDEFLDWLLHEDYFEKQGGDGEIYKGPLCRLCPDSKCAE